MAERRTSHTSTALGLGAATVGAVGIGAVVAAKGRGAAKPSGAKPAPVRAAAKTVGSKAKGAAKGAGKAAKTVGKVTLPAAPVVSNLVQNHKQIVATAAHHMKAIKAGESGAKMAALGSIGKALGPASTLVLPVLAATAAITTARAAYAKRGRLDDAATEGATSAADLILGSALTEYTKAREAGQGRASSIVEASLKGLDNRFAFGLFQKGFASMMAASESARALREGGQPMPGSPYGVPQQADPITSSIVEHERRAQSGAPTLPRSFGDVGPPRNPLDAAIQAKDADRKSTDAMLGRPGAPGRATGRLALEDRHKFAEANAKYTERAKKAERPTPKATASEADKSGRKPGFSPEAIIASYKKRHPDGENVPYGGDPSAAPDYEPPVTVSSA